jgi:hypothetical protein
MYYTVFVIDLASRRIMLAGSTPWPNEMFMRQVVRSLTNEEGFLIAHRVVICDRDGKWSREVRARLGDAGIERRADARLARPMPTRMPNASYDLLRPNASIGSSRSATAISVAHSPSTSPITTSSAITKGWATP